MIAGPAPPAPDTSPDHAGTPPAVVALVASAGGLGALSSVLTGLAGDLPVAVVVAQHLGGHGRMLVDILRRRVPLSFDWAAEGAPLVPGKVVVCPPRTVLEVLPDGTLALTPAAGPGAGGVLDGLLASLADSFGPRALAVVLTGMGRDGAAGAQALKRAGGTVIAQSEASAEHASMPRAVVDSGAADLVLDLRDIGPVLRDIVHGGAPPRPPGEEAVFPGSGEVARLLREVDWEQTTLGPVWRWPAPLVAVLRTVLDSPVGMCLLWGPDLLQFYNDAYRVVMGAKHPAGLGRAVREYRPERWHLDEPRYARVLAGESAVLKDALYPVIRHGRVEDAWFDLTFSPVRDDTARPLGVLVMVTETTAEVLSRRRLGLLNALATRTRGAPTRRAALESVLVVLDEDVPDVPFAVGYLVDPSRGRVELVGAVGVDPGGPMAPHTAPLTWRRPRWPFDEVVRTGEPAVVEDLARTFRGVLIRHTGGEPDRAVVFPLGGGGDRNGPTGVLILGVNPGLPLDDGYRDFLRLLCAQVDAAVAEAAGRQAQRERIDQLADLNRAKTEFLSAVSHELRTPLTLLMASLEDLADPGAALTPVLRDRVDVAARNTRRLAALVETLLDFSRIDAGTLGARFEPTDLATLTADVAGAFRGAVSRAGLVLRVDCPPLSGPVPVDPAMWEKIVANLLSNALKFTFDGEIAVELRELADHVELTVRDSGVGIPEEELPHLFTRFHRVRTTRARTREGAGAGLALVQELARRHRGRVRVRSTVGEGSRFTVWVPKQQNRPPGPDAPRLDGRLPVGVTLAEVAGRWSADRDEPAAPGAARSAEPTWCARLLVVDDNRDMRDYLTRLLSPTWHVRAVGDERDALELAREQPPDLVIADVALPGAAGLEVVRRLRADPVLHDVPVILLSALAGGQPAVEGLAAGADDYLVKPFASGELVARVTARLARARRLREQADRRFRALVEAGFDVVYRMNPDWTELCHVDGRGFVVDTGEPSRTWLDTYIHPDDQPEVLAAVRRAVATRSVFELEHRVIRADGTLGRALSRAVPVVEDGEVVEWVGAAIELPPPACPDVTTGRNPRPGDRNAGG